MILDIITILIAIWILINFVNIFFSIKIMKNNFDELPKEFEEEINKLKILICFTETHNNIIYVWEKENNTFLTQGKDMEEVVQYFVKNHPNTKVLFERKQVNGI